MRTPGVWKAVLLAGLLLAGGCGKKLVSTSGTLTLGGQPLGGAVVSLYPEGAEGEYAHGVTEEDGSFHLATRRENGVLPGTYRITVVKRDPAGQKVPGQPRVPGEYGTKESTPLQCTIPHDGPLKLDLPAGKNRQ